MRRLLIVEDSALQRCLYQRSVETQDPHFVVHSAGTLAHGLAEAATFQPEVVLLDLHLPDSDGEPTLDHIMDFKRGEPAAKVIVMSADSTLRERALAQGADDFMEKAPGDSAPLLARINSLLSCPSSSPPSS